MSGEGVHTTGPSCGLPGPIATQASWTPSFRPGGRASAVTACHMDNCCAVSRQDWSRFTRETIFSSFSIV